MLEGYLSQEELKALSRMPGRFLGITNNSEWRVMTALTFNFLAFKVICILLQACYTQLTDTGEVSCMKFLGEGHRYNNCGVYNLIMRKIFSFSKVSKVP